MKNIRFIFFILVLGVTGAAQAAAENSDVLHHIDLTESETAQKYATTLQTGIFELDNANKMYGASPFLLGNNRLKLVFSEPVLLSILKAVYGYMSCVDEIELVGLDLVALHGKGLRKMVVEITLKLKADAYQKAMYYVNFAQRNALDAMLGNSTSYVAQSNVIDNSSKKNRLAKYVMRLLNR